MVKVICVTGMRGGGKTVFGGIARSMGLPIYEMRTIVVEMMEKESIEISNRNIREYAKSIREQFGKDVVAKKMVERIGNTHTKDDVIVIVGIRGMYETRTFREAFGEKNVILLAIYAPPKLRYERLVKKEAGIKENNSYEEFLWSDEMELGFGVAKAIALADVMIVNDGTIEEYTENCRKIIRKIIDGEVKV
ncbi:MAG: AAA family ATPase [Candidatus Micrarchaeia archaeon]